MSPLWVCPHVTTSVNILRCHGLNHTLWICYGLFLVPHVRLFPTNAWAWVIFTVASLHPVNVPMCLSVLPFVRIWAVSYFSIMNVVGYINYRLMAMPALHAARTSPVTPQTDHEAYYGMTTIPSPIKEHSPDDCQLLISMNRFWKQTFLDYI